MKKEDKPKRPVEEQGNNSSDPEGYPLYPESEDIYSQYKEEQDIDPEDITRYKEPVPEIETESEEDLVPELDDDLMGDDLDVPGAELDDDQEEIGNEDEENNYYSIGGDNHHDLEEDDGILDEDL